MILITIAVSTAAISQWASEGSSAANKTNAQPQTLLVSDAR
jgi:hypothetical protein